MGALAILLLKVPILVAVCPAFFVNGTLWGQFDVVLTLFLMAAVLALLLDRPVAAGAAVGLKLLAIVPVPFLALSPMRPAPDL